MLTSRIAPSAIRVATDADADGLSALMRSTFLDAYGHSSTPGNIAAHLEASYTPDKQRAEIANPEILTLIFEGTSDAAWAGYAQLRFTTRPPLEIDLVRPVELGRIYLSRPFHGLGLAHVLMERLVDEASMRGGDGLWLSAWKEAPQAIRFYEKQGFRIAGPILFAVGDDAKEDWLMVRVFPAA